MRFEESTFLDALREPRPDPGGGSVSEAIACPYEMVVEVADSFELILEIGRNCSSCLIPDLLVVLEIMRASARSGFHIAMANVECVEDRRQRRLLINELESAVCEAEQNYSSVLRRLKV